MIIKCPINSFTLEASHLLKRKITDLLNLKKEGSINIALSGGNTPLPLYSKLSESDLAWNRINIFIVDERCVSEDSEESNYGQIKKIFENTASKIHKFYDNKLTPQSCIKNYELILKKKVEKKSKIPSLDLIILGMGLDGHTASLFPNEPSLESNKIVTYTKPKNTKNERVSFTYSLILNATEIILLLTGKEKANLYQQITDNSLDYHKYPVAKINSHSNLTTIIGTDE